MANYRWPIVSRQRTPSCHLLGSSPASHYYTFCVVSEFENISLAPLLRWSFQLASSNVGARCAFLQWSLASLHSAKVHEWSADALMAGHTVLSYSERWPLYTQQRCISDQQMLSWPATLCFPTVSTGHSTLSKGKWVISRCSHGRPHWKRTLLEVLSD